MNTVLVDQDPGLRVCVRACVRVSFSGGGEENRALDLVDVCSDTFASLCFSVHPCRPGRASTVERLAQTRITEGTSFKRNVEQLWIDLEQTSIRGFETLQWESLTMSKPPNENVTTYKLVVVGDGGQCGVVHLIFTNGDLFAREQQGRIQVLVGKGESGSSTLKN